MCLPRHPITKAVLSFIIAAITSVVISITTIITCSARRANPRECPHALPCPALTAIVRAWVWVICRASTVAAWNACSSSAALR
jgi:hypothetical protein|eukprot:SAG25_NODE_1838_length_2277_cov_3.380051_2_plen_83_part_00